MRISVPVTYRNAIAALHDAAMAGASFILALYLRLGDQFSVDLPYVIPGTAIFTCIALAVFTAMRLYRGLWRYASLPDLIALTKAVSIAIAAFSLLLFAITRLENIPRSLPFIQWMLLLFMLGAPRFLYRALKDRTLRFDIRHDAREQIPILMVGSGPRAEAFIRQSVRDRDSMYRVVGVVDDDKTMHHRTLHGIRIYGGIDALPAVAAKMARKGLPPQRIILADGDDSIPPALLDISEQLGLALGRLPRMEEFKEGVFDKTEIRPLAIEDLLGRAQNVHDRSGMQQLIAGKIVAVTGAGGSIGSELVRQIAAFGPKRLLLMEQCEYALYEIDREIAERFPSVACAALLADVRNEAQIRSVFSREKPAIVFHAAAIKHVPLSEANPVEAIETNVLGTRRVADAAKECGAQAMVLISTDKAVNPANVMGATKRLAESYCQALGSAQSATRYFTVRFGNVLGSTGSVVPLFKKQLERGGPVTVTHPDMVRYFMTIREAVELVILAAATGMELPERREAVFVLDMGKPVRIVDLAVQMIRLSGLKPGKDIEIVYTGLRPGEKLFEELFYDAEAVKKTAHKSILIASAREYALQGLEKSLAGLENACRERNATEATALLASLVPEFRRAEELAA